jgi:predicted RND superfamily exporter protein
MNGLGAWIGWLARRRVVAAVMVLGLVGPLAAGLPRLRLHGNALDFLPDGHPDVEAFRAVAARFRLLDTILVLLQAPAGAPEGIFTTERLAALRAVTDAAGTVPGVANVLSLANVLDVGAAADTGGVDVHPLLPAALPAAPAELAALRAAVLGRAHIVGSLVSADGDTALVIVTPAAGSDAAALVPALRAALAPATGPLAMLLGGAPAIDSAASAMTSAPRTIVAFAGLAALLALLLALAFGPAGAVALVPGALAAAATLGLAGWLRAPPWALLLDPVVALGALATLVAGAAAAAPLLAARRGGASLPDALAAAGARPLLAPVAAAAPFAALALVTEGPLHQLGLVTAPSAALAGLLAVPVLAAVLGARAPAPARAGTAAPLAAAGAAAAHALARVRPIAGRLVVLAALGAALFTFGADRPADLSVERGFPAGSETIEATRLLATEVGGYDLLHVHLTGDLRDPHVLRVLRSFQDRVELLPGVRGTRSFADAVSLVAEAMLGRPGLPATRAAVADMIAFLDSDPAVRALAAEDRTEALLLVELDGPDVRGEIAARVRATLAAVAPADRALVAVPVTNPAGRDALAREIAWRVLAAVHRAAAAGPGATRLPEPAADAVERLAVELSLAVGTLPPAPVAPTAAALAALMEDPAFPVDLAHGAPEGTPPDFAAAARALAAAPADAAPELLEKLLREGFPAAAADPTEAKYFPDAARRVHAELVDARLRAFLDGRGASLARSLGAPDPAAAAARVAAALAGIVAPTGLMAVALTGPPAAAPAPGPTGAPGPAPAPPGAAVAFSVGEPAPLDATPVLLSWTLSGGPLLGLAAGASVRAAIGGVSLAVPIVGLLLLLAGAGVRGALGGIFAAWGATGLGLLAAGGMRPLDLLAPAEFALGLAAAGALIVLAVPRAAGAGGPAPAPGAATSRGRSRAPGTVPATPAARAGAPASEPSTSATAFGLGLALAPAIGVLMASSAPPLVRLALAVALAAFAAAPLAALAVSRPDESTRRA